MEFKIESSSRRRFALALGLLCLLVASAGAQDDDSKKGKLPATRLLTVEEGRSIVDGALNQEQPSRGAQDCSHLAHQIYLSAGFAYPYASSFELFSGDENFARVRFPRGGDLIVWPGHVGIVVDPSRHTFFSLVSTGSEVQDYEASYWRSRGRPRFYRYRVQNDAVLNTFALSASPEISDRNGGQSEEMVVEQHSAEESSGLNQSPKTASKRAAVAYGSPAPLQTAKTVTAFEVPSSILVAIGSKPPTREEVTEGISELNDAAGHILRSDDFFKIRLPVIIVEQFNVEHVDTRRDRGWVRLQINSKVSIDGGTIQQKQLREKARWELRRLPSGWEVLTPGDRTYVPHDVAVKNLSAQLAGLAQSDPTSSGRRAVLRQESRIAALLNALLENEQLTSR